MSGTLNDMIISAINGAEEDEGLSSGSLAPVIEKTASASRVDEGEIEKIASALEWYGRTGVRSFVELDKRASSPDLAGIQNLMEQGDVSLTQAVATTHPTLPSSARAEIVEALSEKTAKASYGMSAGKSAGKSYKSSPAGEQPTACDGDMTHHPSLSSNEAAINYTKAEKSKRSSGSLSRILDAKPFADPGLQENLAAARKGGIDPNIHAKTASEKARVKSLVKSALAKKIAAQVQG
jgi:hypothetical protein